MRFLSLLIVSYALFPAATLSPVMFAAAAIAGCCVAASYYEEEEPCPVPTRSSP